MAYTAKTRASRGIHATPKSAPHNASRPFSMLATGLTIGLLVGGGVALLFAPARGLDTRRKIQRGTRRAQLSGRDAWESLRVELRHARRQLKRARRRAELAVADRGAELPD